MEHYIAWMKSAYWITTTFPGRRSPFPQGSLPLASQSAFKSLVGISHFPLLQFAYAFEQETRFGTRRPSLA